jgi:hypothetical protein
MNDDQHHFVQHFLSAGDYVKTLFTCTAPVGAACRMACDICMKAQKDRCECLWLKDFPAPDIKDQGQCLTIPWFNDTPEEMYDGSRQPVRWPDPQPIKLVFDGESVSWDYAL